MKRAADAWRSYAAGSEVDVAWAAGLFEGEGYITRQNKENARPGIRLGLKMTDEEPVRRFAEIVGVGRVMGPHAPRRSHWKTSWEWRVLDREGVERALTMLWPYLGERHRSRATELRRERDRSREEELERTCYCGKPFRALRTGHRFHSRRCGIEKAGKNPQPKAREIRPLTVEELGKVVDEIGSQGPLVTFAAETGLRPCEWLALERRDVDRAGRVLYVEREHVDGETKAYLKTTASRRSVPLTVRALDALEELPPRLDSALLFPAVRGGYMNLRNWRSREWDTAVESAGLAVCKCGHLSGVHDLACAGRACHCEGFERSVLSPVPYVLRHTFASNALAAGVGTFELARVMGTSLEMIERTYGHLVRGADDAFRSRLEAFASGRDDRAELAR